ncbi:MAG TPA: hypothetical protein VNK43_02490 [Gemmatimonadales bacterium]|nr:hypothetical protein [Gemmatimonadales bacterium]
MLTPEQVRQRHRRRPPPSLKQVYQEYLMQRIESFKNSIPREELLRLGDEAVSELAATSEGQFVLTEVLMLDSVDRLIMKRLALRPYKKWRAHFLKLRAAQRAPTHWGIDPSSPIAQLLPRIEPGDAALLIGPATEPYAYLLAAHDMDVTFVAADLGCVERVESRMASESLGTRFTALALQIDHWLPETEQPPHVLVLDTAALAGAEPGLRAEILATLQEQTAPGGVHLVLPGSPALAPDTLASLYPRGWTRERRGGERRRGGRPAVALVMNKACHDDTAGDVSDRHDGTNTDCQDVET